MKKLVYFLVIVSGVSLIMADSQEEDSGTIFNSNQSKPIVVKEFTNWADNTESENAALQPTNGVDIQECTYEECCCAEDVSTEKKEEKKVSRFEALPENSFVRKRCMNQESCPHNSAQGLCSNCHSRYHCEAIDKFLYCAAIWHKELSETSNKTIDEIVLCNFCSDHDHDWQNMDYWAPNYHVKNIGEQLKVGPDEIMEEQKLIIRHLLALNEPVRLRAEQAKTVQSDDEKKVAARIKKSQTFLEKYVGKKEAD